MNEPEPYKPQYTYAGGWKRLVLSEPEWLARPDVWCFDLLPELMRPRKEWLFYYPYLLWHLGQVTCRCARSAEQILARGDERWLRPYPENPDSGLQLPPYAPLDEAVRAAPPECRAGVCFVYSVLWEWRQCAAGNYTIANFRHSFTNLVIGWPDGSGGARDWASVRDKFEEQRMLRERLLRCIVGNPFRPAPAVDVACLDRQDSTVARLARACYDDRRLPAGTLDPARLAVLADALEDAGCGDAELFGHLRGPGPHVRGCWAVDFVLGKE
jgi:hypothetical protein